MPGGFLGGIEVDDFLRCALEGEDDGVRGEDGEVGVIFLEAWLDGVKVPRRLRGVVAYVDEMELIGRRSNAVGEEQHIAGEPGDLGGWALVAGSWCFIAHVYC
jgi:hypothetical protein